MTTTSTNATAAEQLERAVRRLVDDYIARNAAVRVLTGLLDQAGIGLLPVIDHITLRTLDIDRCAARYVELGYVEQETLTYGDWYAKVYRCPGFPALFVDQAYTDDRGKTSIIPGWVRRFGDETLHHVAVRVDEIETAITVMQARGIRFAGAIVGEKGGVLRQIFTAPEQVHGEPFSVLELTERHAGFQGFSPPQADGLMRSTARVP
jgi:catechol 2,3-dioxygenase-like lactoylglutathione lyase family enzyme